MTISSRFLYIVVALSAAMTSSCVPEGNPEFPDAHDIVYLNDSLDVVHPSEATSFRVIPKAGFENIDQKALAFSNQGELLWSGQIATDDVSCSDCATCRCMGDRITYSNGQVESTKRYLSGQYTPTDPSEWSGTDIAEVQSYLKDLGYRIGVPDGDYGRRTATALGKFKARKELPERVTKGELMVTLSSALREKEEFEQEIRDERREQAIKKCLAIGRSYRVGATCGDGWTSSSTGRGTCSHHGGVRNWRYEKRSIYTRSQCEARVK